MPSSDLYTLEQIGKYCSKKYEAHLLLDTNVLLIFLLGNHDLSYLKECPLMTAGKRSCDEKDFEIVVEIIKRFPNKIAVSPYVISEVNMLSRIHIKPESRLKSYFTTLIRKLEDCKEHSLPLKVLLNSGGMMEFGITDISLIETAKEKKWLILTNDAPFYRQFYDYGFIISLDTIKANSTG